MTRNSSPSDRLDEALEAVMRNPDAPLPAVSPQLAALLRIAADLRGLPRSHFKATLEADLLSAAGSTERSRALGGGPPVRTPDEIEARLREMAREPKLVAHDVRAALKDLPELTMRFLASLNQCTIGVSRFSEHSHWECHPAGDELLHFIEGDADITTLTDAGPIHSVARAGSVFICPRGLWHRIRPRSPVSLLFATPGKNTRHSSAANPRRRRRDERPTARRAGKSLRPKLEAHDIGAAVRSVPPLAIAESTTAAEADASFRRIASLGRCTISVGRFSGETPWERHPRGDELLHILEGEVEITVLADEGPVQRVVPAGSVFVCPRGLWHRQRASTAVTALYATPKPSEISWAENPREPLSARRE